MNFKEKWDDYRKSALNELHRATNSDQLHPGMLEAMKYSLFSGGKRLRPVLALAVSDMLGDAGRALPIAAAIEMIHTYSLIHDDLPAMDDDALRRGRPTSHVVFGEANAILAGDGLINLAYETLLSGALTASDREGYLRAAALVAWCAGCAGMVGGQAEDLKNEGNAQAGEKELMYIHRRKTGALIRAAVLGGALVHSPTGQTLEKLESYAENLGLAFQITDDVLDVVGDSKKMGKTLGKDEKVGKLTFVRVYGLERARTMAKAHIERARAAAQELEGSWFLLQTADFVLNRDN